MGTSRDRANVALYRSLYGVDVLYDGQKVQASYPSQRDLWVGSYCKDAVNETEILFHPEKFRREARGLNIGGPLDLRSVKCDFPVGSNYVGRGDLKGSHREYTGPIIAYPNYAPTARPTTTSLSVEASADTVPTRIALGATAIERCKPASPQSSFGVFLAELVRDGIPSTLSELARAREPLEVYRGLGKDYLNVEFGWKPFLADIQSTARALLHQAAILEDLRRNSGKPMRRAYSFPLQEERVNLATDNVLPWPTPHVLQARRTIDRTTTKKTWFAGEFRYYYPPVASPAPTRLVAWARSILGLSASPDLIWNAAPWSWLADWMSNIGDVTANISAITEDNLTMRYGYLMQEATREYRLTHHGLTIYPGGRGSITPTLTGVVTYSHKTRIGASPYGFGVTWDGLTARQLAILAAIGITRQAPKGSL